MEQIIEKLSHDNPETYEIPRQDSRRSFFIPIQDIIDEEIDEEKEMKEYNKWKCYRRFMFSLAIVFFLFSLFFIFIEKYLERKLWIFLICFSFMLSILSYAVCCVIRDKEVKQMILLEMPVE